MAEIRPAQLPSTPTVNQNAAIIVDDGAVVNKATPVQLLNAAAPLASQAEAEAGSDNAKRVTPLRVKQAIEALAVSSTDLASADNGKGAAKIGTSLQVAGAKATTQAEVNLRVRHVMDFVTPADRASIYAGTPVDIAYAYNAATRADEPWSIDLAANIVAPDKPHLLNSPVYIRAGQFLSAAGEGPVIECVGNTTGNAFNLGRRSNGDKDLEFHGGPPTGISRLRINGPLGTGYAVAVYNPGYRVSDIFITGAFGGLLVDGGSEAVVTNVTVELAQVGVRMTNARNATLANVLLWRNKQNWLFGSRVFDTTVIGGATIYPHIHYLYAEEGAEYVRGLTIVGHHVTMSQHTDNGAGGNWATFEAGVRIRGSNIELKHVGCHFRNWKGPLLKHDQGFYIETDWDGCTFDAQVTDEPGDYAQTTDAYMANLTLAGTHRFTGGTVLRMPVQPFTVAGGAGVAIDLQLKAVTFAENTGGTVDVAVTNTNPGSRTRILACASDRTLWSKAPGAVVHALVSAGPDTGWVAGGGADLKTDYFAYNSSPMAATYTQTEMQALSDNLGATTYRLLSLERAMRKAGLIDG